MIYIPFLQSGAGGVMVIDSLQDNLLDGDIAIPAHEAGDLVVMIQRASATFPSYDTPATQSGFTSLAAADDMTYAIRYRVQWKVDTDNSFTTISAGSASDLFTVILIRGASGIGAVAMTKGDNLGPPATIPGLTLTDTSGASLVLAGVFTNQSYELTDPASHTRLEGTPIVGGGMPVVWVYDGATSSYAGDSVPWTGAAYWTAFAVEVMA